MMHLYYSLRLMEKTRSPPLLFHAARVSAVHVQCDHLKTLQRWQRYMVADLVATRDDLITPQVTDEEWDFEVH
jgi:hypothetical protein